MARVVVTFTDEADGSAHVRLDSDVAMNVPGRPNTLAMELSIVAIDAVSKSGKLRGGIVAGVERANGARWRPPWWR